MANRSDVISFAREPKALKALAGYSKGAALHGMGSAAASPVRNDSPLEEAGFEPLVPLADN